MTGRHVFGGETVSHVLASVLKDEPDWAALPANTPASIRRLLRRCLEKDRKRRLDSASAARLEIEDALTTPSAESSPTATPGRSRAVGRERWFWAAAIIASLVAGAALSYRLRPSPVPLKGVRFEIPAATSNTSNPFAIAVSPDGQQVVYAAPGKANRDSLLWVRRVDAIEGKPIPGTESANNPLCSPDSRMVAFVTPGNRLMKCRVDGCRPELVASGATGRCAWGTNDVILCADRTRTIQQFSASGGAGRSLLDLDKASAEFSQAWPSMLPDGDHFVYLSRGQNRIDGSIRLASVAQKTSRPLLAADSQAVFAGGFVFFVRDTTLWAQRLDAVRLELLGNPVAAAEHVLINGSNGRAAFDVAADGTLIYRTGLDDSTWRLAWVNRQDGTRLSSVTALGQFVGPAPSPDGARVAFHRIDRNGGDLWIAEASGGRTSRLTFEASQENSSALWSPDGKRIVFRSRRKDGWGLYEKSSDGLGVESLLRQSLLPETPLSSSSDGRFILFMVSNPSTGWDIWSFSTADRKASPLLVQPFNEGHPQLSPDGRWMAYNSNETGAPEVYVQSFPPGTGKWQVSTGSGLFPLWRRDGKELFFLSGDRGRQTVLAADVKTLGNALDFSAPHALFETPLIGGAILGFASNYLPWAASADGQRFLIQQPDAGTDAGDTPITVVVNWMAARDK